MSGRPFLPYFSTQHITSITIKSQYDCVGQIIAYESGELDQDGVIELFRHLIATGMINGLQGHYGRTAAALQDGGYL